MHSSSESMNMAVLTDSCLPDNVCVVCFQSLVIPEKFQHILRVLNTNIDGRRKIAFAITAIKVKSHLCFMLHFLQVTRMHLSMFVAQLSVRVSVVCQTFIITLTCLSVWSQGVGRRYAHVVLRKADIDLNKRAGELTDEEVRRARCLQTHTQSRWLQDSVWRKCCGSSGSLGLCE